MPVRNRDAAGDGAQQPRVVLIFAAMDLIFGLLNLLSVAMESIETVPEVSSYADYYGGPVHALLTMGSTNEMASTVQAAASGLTASTVIMAALGLMGVQQKKSGNLKFTINPNCK
ncbi:hypothetical protein FOL47_006211 [Perkinsus chesapeaki]|uniref:Uncharacterized protein n=1 Tax=Perkinsus chesapeaki TaxID=330153 RepID=A0A7J6LTD7_PERCH|nr:hypothetical protein FOL47_006211 [Perkinsus chesapeaki]